MTLDKNFPTILFSIEIAARELDSKLVMASALAKQGCRSIVGHKEVIREIARNSRNVVWQGKSIFSSRSDEHIADRLISNDSVIMYISDEGAMHQADAWVEQTLQKHCVNLLRTREVGRLCVWGARQMDTIAKHAPELQRVLAVTGSARFDLCLPEYSWVTENHVQELSDEIGPYILVCTRFGAIAHAKGMGAPFQNRLNNNFKNLTTDSERKTAINQWFNKWRQDTLDFAEFITLIKQLAQSCPDYRILLRPHPSESVDFYNSAFSSIKNVAVKREGNVLPWIRGAALVLHSNCTTGIEAVLAGRPTVNFLPPTADRSGMDVEVAREAGVEVSSIGDALESIAKLLAGEEYNHNWSGHAESMLHNLSHESVPILTRETVNILKQKGIDSSSVKYPNEKHLRHGSRRILDKINPSKQSDDYVKLKRGEISAEHVEMIISGCKSRGIGCGNVSHLTKRYTVIEPI